MQDAVKIFEQIRPWVVQLNETERLRLIRSIAGVASEIPQSDPAPKAQAIDSQGLAQRDGETADEIAELLLIEQEWWYSRSSAEKQRYSNEFVAIYGNKVVDHDQQRLALLRRIRLRFGLAPVAILPAAQTNVPEYLVHQPHIVV